MRFESRHQLLHAGQTDAQHLEKLCLGNGRLALATALNFDQFSAERADDVDVGLGTRVLFVIEVQTYLPIDQNGALYLVEWSTTDGQSYNLVLRDGASGQPAATVPVKPLQSQGRFVFVGYRVE